MTYNENDTDAQAAAAALLFPKSAARAAKIAQVEADIAAYRATTTMSARFAAARKSA